MGEAKGSALPIEVKSGKGYRRHVALNNLLRTREYGIGRAYVLSEANVGAEERGGRSRALPPPLHAALRGAGDEDEVPLRACPGIPEVLERRLESGARRVEPRCAWTKLWPTL